MNPRIRPQEPPFADSVQRHITAVMPPGVPPLLLFRVLARDERLFSRFADGALLDRGQLSVRERELVILRVCANNGSEYEWGVHVAGFAWRAGFSPEQLSATVHGAVNEGCWSAREQLLLQLCDALKSACTLEQGLFDALRAELSEEALLELLLLTGFYRTVSTLTGALTLPLEAWSARFPPAPAPSHAEPG